MPSAWQLIPEGIMLQQERKKKADDWAMQQRRLLSQRWAEQQRQNIGKFFDDAWTKTFSTENTIPGRVMKTWETYEEDSLRPGLETATWIGSRGIEGTDPTLGVEALKKGWEERPEPIPGFKGGIEALADPTNVLPIGKLGKAAGIGKEVIKEIPGILKEGLTSPGLRRLAPGLGIEDISKTVPKAGKELIEAVGQGISEADRLSMAKTARGAGAVGDKARVPRYVEESAQEGERILDFGAGKEAKHTLRLKSKGLDVTAIDLPENIVEGLHDPNALSRKYNTVMASNVLNVQTSPEVLQKTLNTLKSVVESKGRVIANYPLSPRYIKTMKADELESILKQHFEEVRRVGGNKQEPVFELRGFKEAVEKIAPKRFYHGTGSAFDRPDAAKFDPNGLYGPGYYLTDNPEVAGSYAGVVRPTVELKQIENELLDTQARLYQAQNPQNIGFGTTTVNPDKVQMYQQQVSALVEKLENLQTRPNIRAINVPQNLRLLDAEAPVPDELLQKLDAWANKYNLDTLDYLDPYSKPANGHELWKDLARASEETDYPNLVLKQMGYDGIRYQGGKRIPMKDATGNPIEHEALVIFPESLSKIKNAISGTEGGRVSANMALDVGGGVAGAYSQYDPNASMEENLPRMGLGFAGGYGTMYGGRKGLAGLGVKKLPPNFILPGNTPKGGQILGPAGQVLKNVPAKPPKPKKSPVTPAYTGPVRRTTFARIWDRSRNVIARQGEGGRAIANMLVDSREKGEMWAGGMLSRLKSVRSLTDREFEQFWDVAEGVPLPNISPKVRQAVHDWSYVRNEIYSRTVQNKMDIGFEDLYMPHEYDFKKIAGDKTRWESAIDHLVKTKQANSRAEAIGKLRYMENTWRDKPYGHLEFKREADWPDYKKNKDVLFRYIEGAAQRIADIETFGKDMKNMNPLLDQISQEGFDADTAKDMLKVATRGFSRGRWDPLATNVRMYNVYTKLGLGAVSNAQQSVNTGTITGIRHITKNLKKATTEEGYEYALKSGTILDGVIKQVRMGAGYEAGKLAAPGFNTVEIFNRTLAALAGKDYAIDMAKKAAKGNKNAITALNKMRLNGTDIATRGTLTEDEMIKASRNIVERTQFRVDPQDLPGWGSSTWGKLVMQFRTFSYNQTAFIKNEVIDPALKGKTGPLIRFMIMGMPIGALAYETRSAITQRNRPESTERLLLDYFMQVGGIGLVGDMIRGILPSEGGKYIDPGRRWAIMSSLVGGPTLQNAVDVVGSASDLAQGKPTYAERTALRQVPVVGQTLQNVIRPYKGNEPKQTGSGLQNYINKTKSGGNKSGLQKYIEKAKKGD